MDKSEKTIQGKKRSKEELRAWRIEHCKKIQKKGAEARRKKVDGQSKYKDYFDPKIGLLDRSKYQDFQSIIKSRFNSIIEELYKHKDRIKEILNDAIEKKYITRRQRESILKNLGWQDVDFDTDTAFDRKIKLWSLNAIEFLGRLATGNFRVSNRHNLKSIELRKEAAIKILEYHHGKPRQMEDKGSSGNIIFVDDIAMAHKMDLLDEDLKDYLFASSRHESEEDKNEEPNN